MKNRILQTLFCLIFCAVGLGFFIWMGVKPVLEWQGMKSWDETVAYLTSAELSSSTDSDGSTTYRAKAEYQYDYGGRRYHGDRVGIFGGGDNVGSFQEELGRKLERAHKQKRPVPVFVNPRNPGEAVLNRDMRWEMLGFASVFGIAFFGMGSGFLYLIWRGGRRKTVENNPEIRDKPWLANDKWQSPTVLSDAKFGVTMIWFFAVIWNGMTCYMPFIVYQEITEKQNYPVLIALLFNLVGAGIIYAAVKATREWRRFGEAPLTLDPFPAALGGHAGGYVDVNLPYDPSARFDLTLTHLVGSYSRSGKNQRYREKAEWQDSLYAHTATGPKGTRVFFRFNVPDGQQPSDAETSSMSYDEERHIWRLNFHADLPGADFVRDYDIPVYDTADKTSQNLPEREMAMMQEKNTEILKTAVKEAIPLRYGAAGTEIFYRAGRNIGLALFLLVFGAVFAGGGVVAWTQGAEYFMGGVFILVGSLVVISGIYTVGNSLLTTMDGTYLKTVRSVFGIPVLRRQLRKDLIADIVKHSSFQSQKGTKVTMSYAIRVLGNQGEKLTIVEGLQGASKADAAIKYVTQQLNL